MKKQYLLLGAILCSVLVAALLTPATPANAGIGIGCEGVCIHLKGAHTKPTIVVERRMTSNFNYVKTPVGHIVVKYNMSPSDKATHVFVQTKDERVTGYLTVAEKSYSWGWGNRTPLKKGAHVCAYLWERREIEGVVIPGGGYNTPDTSEDTKDCTTV